MSAPEGAVGGIGLRAPAVGVGVGLGFGVGLRPGTTTHGRDPGRRRTRGTARSSARSRIVLEGGLAGALQRSCLFEAAMTTLLHGPNSREWRIDPKDECTAPRLATRIHGPEPLIQATCESADRRRFAGHGTVRGPPLPIAGMPTPWWQTAVVYQIYPRSFADTQRRRRRRPGGHPAAPRPPAWLGVDAIWLSPFFRSPMADFGYDVSDYCDVDPLFGDLDAFDRLVADAHDRGIKVIVDWVPNHTSDQHPWFQDARSSPRRRRSGTGTSGATPTPTASPPNNWVEAFERPVRRGPSTRRPASGTSTSSCPSSPT